MMRFVVLVSALAVVSSLPADYNYDEHAEELENEYQGDMVISQEDLDAFNGRIDESRRWENNIVPYSINMTYFSELKLIVKSRLK